MTWDNRGSRHERGYGAEWDRLRVRILQRDGHLCQCPRCLGGKLRYRAASEVDHIKPKAQGGSDDPANLRAVNRECHRRISVEQRGGKPRERLTYGLDGHPIE